MSLLTPAQLKQFIAENHLTSAQDVQEALKAVFAETLQAMLEGELNTHLGYEKYAIDHKQTPNSRNGRSKKTLSTQYGDVELAIPRDRQGTFEPAVVPKYQTTMPGIEDQIVALYARGMTTRDIQAQLQDLYGMDVSPTLISNVTDKLLPVIQEWQQRPLAAVYPVVFLDAVHFKVRQDGRVVTKAAYMVVGINLEGYKEVLGMWIGEHESAKFWLSVLTELKSRGVQDILVVAVDNLTGFSEAIAAVFPRADVQKCLVHQIRNSLKYVARKDFAALTADLKPIYKADTEAGAKLAMETFEAAWGKKYPMVVRSWRDNWTELMTFFQYPPALRKILYTTNLIEGFHRQLRKVTKAKAQFPTDEALVKMLYLATREATRKWTTRIQNWGEILGQLEIYFEDRVRQPLHNLES